MILVQRKTNTTSNFVNRSHHSNPFLGLSVFLFILFLWFSSASAQEFTEWTPFEQVPGYQDDTFPPIMVADRNKTVHAFAMESAGDDSDQKDIVYRTWRLESGWSEKIDIIVAGSGEARVLGVFLDRIGKMHLIFQRMANGAPYIYYSSAPAISAGRATSWSTPVAVGHSALLPSSGAIAGDGNDKLTLIYNGKEYGNGVYAVTSSDSGRSWSEPEPLFRSIDPNLFPYSLQLYPGQDNKLHSAWNLVDSRGVDNSLFYARQDIGSQAWSEPVLLDKRIEEEGYFGPSFPAIVDNGETVVIMYNGGSEAWSGFVDRGRPVQRVHFSTDNGDNWSPATEPFPRLQGRSGSHALVVDGSGVVHALVIQRIDQTVDGQWEPIGGMWHSELRDQRWREPERIRMGLSGHDLSAVISQGNTILVTMREDPGAGESGIYYAYSTFDLPELPIVLLPEISAQVALPPVTESIGAEESSPVSSEPDLPNTNSIAVDEVNDPGDLLTLALLPVVIVLAGIVIAYQLIRRFRPKSVEGSSK